MNYRKQWKHYLHILSKIIHLRCHFYCRFLHFDLFQAPGDLAHALPAVFRVFNAAVRRVSATPRYDTRIMLRFKVWSSAQVTVMWCNFPWARERPGFFRYCQHVFVECYFPLRFFPPFSPTSAYSKGEGLYGSWQPLGHLSWPLPVNNAIASVFPSSSRHPLCLPCAATWLATKRVKHPQVSICIVILCHWLSQHHPRMITDSLIIGTYVFSRLF